MPINCGFNIEVKYPNTQEAEEEAPNVVDINVFCDRILDVVFDHAGARNIYFSSFHPEICLMMCKKQVSMF